MNKIIANKQESLFKICSSIEDLYNKGFFKTFDQLVNIFENYQAYIIVELKQPNSQLEKEIEIDIEGVEKFSIKAPVNDEYSTIYVTAIELRPKGLSFFPPIDYFSEKESHEYNLNYKQYKEQILNDIFKDLINELKEEFNELIEEEKKKFKNCKDFCKVELGKLLNDFERLNKGHQKETVQDFPSQHKGNKLELDPSKFYLLNELIITNYLGGPWENSFENWFETANYQLFDEKPPNFAYYTEVLQLNESYNNNEMSLFIETHLSFDGNIIKERLLKFVDWGFTSCINPDLRQLKNGVYCPIGKIEYIESLSYSLPVKEKLEQIIRYIETLPLEEQKQGVVKRILTELKESGLETGLPDINNQQIIDTLESVYIKLDKKIESVDKKTEAGIIQIVNMLKSHKNQVPNYFDKLTLDYKERILEILNYISEITIPFNIEEPNKYIEIIAKLGRFVCNVIKTACNSKEDITISKMSKSQYFKKFIEKYNEETQDFIQNYSKKFGKLYNDVRHEPNEVKITFWQVKEFIWESNKVLDIFLNRQ